MDGGPERYDVIFVFVGQSSVFWTNQGAQLAGLRLGGRGYFAVVVEVLAGRLEAVAGDGGCLCRLGRQSARLYPLELWRDRCSAQREK